MTVVLFLVGLVAGAVGGSLGTYRHTITRSDIVTYDTRRDWRALAAQADQDHRSAVRWSRALDAFDRIHRDVVGDLLDTVAGLQAENDLLRAPRHTRRSPIPPYGPERRVA